MGSMRPGGRFLPFSKNIQRTQKQPVPGGFPQSLSGSETDISTDNENLSHEERYVIRHTARVEPQGQENHLSNNNRNSLKEGVPGSNRSSLKESVGGGGSNRSSLDVSSSSYNTLIIHSAGQDEAWPGRLSGIRDHTSELNHQSSQSSPYHTLKSSGGNGGVDKKPSGIPLPVSGGVREHPTLPRGAAYIDIGGQRIYTSPPDHGVQEITEIPDDFLNQSSVLKHLAKEVTRSPTPRSPRGPTPPASPRACSGARESPGRSNRAHSRTPAGDSDSGSRKGKERKGMKKLSSEKLSLSRSQPDLSSVGVRAVPGSSETSGWSSGDGGEDDDAFAAVLDALAAENQHLKHQLTDACSKIAKTNKLEEEVEKVRSAHEELVSSCERRERLERAARTRLQSDCRRLHEVNRALREQAELLSGQALRSPEPGPGVDLLRKELQNREMLIAQLISQNKELACSKERQEIEMSAQRATLQEQRTHIDILDTALTNAQANVVRLEEECRHAGGYVERVAGLQRALASLQQASDRREHTERKLRAQLEKELQALRKRECSCSSGAGGGAGGGEAELRRLVRERDERVLALEGECAKWEQRYLEESALRQAAISAASIPKDAKIAALEKSSQEWERMMAEARTEKIRHMDELHSAQKKCADIEGRVKELESKVAERDAMIKVLQKHTQSVAYDSSASLRNNTSREELVGFGASSSGASFSSTEGVGARYRHLRHNYGSTAPNNSSSNAGCGFESTSLRLDSELAALDARLERPPPPHPPPARALCCFPGLRGPAAGAGGGGGAARGSGRAGKPPAGFLGLGGREPQRPEEMLLLEKQGRSSQQTRANSLPPSSLPRPPRKPSAHRQYDRLDRRKDSDGSASIASSASRGSPLPYERVTRKPPAPLPSVPTSASLPTTDSRESLVRARDSRDSRESLVRARGSLASRDSSAGGGSRDSGPSSRDSGAGSRDSGAGSLPSPSKLAMYAAARRRSTSLNKDTRAQETNKYRIQF